MTSDTGPDLVRILLCPVPVLGHGREVMALIGRSRQGRGQSRVLSLGLDRDKASVRARIKAGPGRGLSLDQCIDGIGAWAGSQQGRGWGLSRRTGQGRGRDLGLSLGHGKVGAEA